jgi:hypothetical protein
MARVDNSTPITNQAVTRLSGEGPMDYTTARPSNSSPFTGTARTSNDAPLGTVKRPSNDAPLS